MAPRVTAELSVGLTPEILSALEVASDFSGLKQSQYGRQAIMEKLVREGFLKHPGLTRIEQKNGVPKQPSELNPAA